MLFEQFFGGSIGRPSDFIVLQKIAQKAVVFRTNGRFQRHRLFGNALDPSHFLRRPVPATIHYRVQRLTIFPMRLYSFQIVVGEIIHLQGRLFGCGLPAIFL